MAKHTVRFPQKGDRVGAVGRNGVFVVIAVHENPNVVDLRLLKGGPTEKNIPWATLTFLDEEDANQAAARIVKEATENH
jgi:hypothetical protein